MASVKAVVFDWAGTVVDYGCVAPVNAFVRAFRSAGVEITEEMARKPMGLPKLEHTRAVAAMLPEPLTEELIMQIYQAFEASLLADIDNHCDLIDHAADVAASLRAFGVRIGSTTGYTAEMMARVLPLAAAQGYAPECCVTPEQAGGGRPYPYMIWENMKRFGISDPREVVKVGDTIADIDEGSSAGCWTVGVILGSSELGLTRGQVAALSDSELQERKARVRAAYYEAGADYILDSLDELPGAVDDINRKLAQGAPRKLLTPGPLTTRRAVKLATLTDHCTWDDEYKAITTSVMQDITAIAADSSYATVLLQGSGTYSVEAMVNCLTAPDEKLLVLANGEYGKRILTILRNSGKRFEALLFGETQPADAGTLEEKLLVDPDIGTVVAVHCETTTGVINPLEEIVKTAKRHGKKVLVDAMSSFAAYPIDMPLWGIDALASSANKCLEGLPGLSFVVARRELLEQSAGRSLSHSLDLHDQYLGLYPGGGKFRFTSPTTILLALRQALDEYRKEGGLPARSARYRANHAALVHGLEQLGFRPLVSPEHQSHIITTFELGDLDFAGFYNALKAKGFVIYPGKLTQLPTFRVGNIGDIYPHDMEALAKAVEEYMAGLNLL